MDELEKVIQKRYILGTMRLQLVSTGESPGAAA